MLDSANGAKIRQILREFGYKIGRYDICDENAQSTLDSANNVLKNNRRVNRVILFFLESVVDSAKYGALKVNLQNLTQNGVEIVVFLKDNAGATTALNFWRKFGIVYLLKNRFIN